MAITNFIPEIWAKVILAALKKNLVFGGPGVSNNDYEGEISGPGSSVQITSFSDPSVAAYTIGSDITWSAPTDSGQTLSISQQAYTNFTVDDIDRRQAAGDFQTYLEERMSYVLAESEDEYVAGLYTGVGSGNILNGSDGSTSSLITGNGLVMAAPTTSNNAQFYNEVVLPLTVRLDQSLVPDDGNRYLVVPPWAHALLRATPAFVSFGYDDVLLNGQLGTIDGFTVYKSQNAVEYDTENSGYVIQAGHPMAITVAEQISTVEAVRLQNQFADGVRALHVYGAKLTRPTAIAVAGVERPAGL